MCGVNNVLLDDPQLTARPDGAPAERQPLRVVADSRGRTPLTAKVLGAGGKTLIATTAASSEQWRREVEARGAEVASLPAGEDGRVDLGSLLELLGERDVLSLLVEGGGVLPSIKCTPSSRRRSSEVRRIPPLPAKAWRICPTPSVCARSRSRASATTSRSSAIRSDDSAVVTIITTGDSAGCAIVKRRSFPLTSSVLIVRVTLSPRRANVHRHHRRGRRDPQQR